MLSKNEIKYIRSLHGKKHRETEGLFIAEGKKWVDELAMHRPEWVQQIFFLPEAYSPPPPVAAAGRAVRAMDMEKISALTHPTPVLAVVRIPTPPTTPLGTTSWQLVLDGIQDPGNMGTIIRIADWYGHKNIWCSPPCADVWQPKVVQATMGSLCRVAVHVQPLLPLLRGCTLPVYLAHMEGTSCFGWQGGPGVLVIGSEGHGASMEVTEAFEKRICIPRSGHAESLNAAVAAGILLSHLQLGA